MRYVLPSIFIIVLILLGVQCSFGQDVPKQIGWVNDYANVLTTQQADSLARRLSNIEKTKPDAPQIVVVTFKTLGDQPIADMTTQLGKEWKLGRKERDNGLIIAVAPNERKYYIAVGYGLESSIPDARTQVIGDNMRAALKANRTDWNAAIVAAVNTVELMLPSEAYDPSNPIKAPQKATNKAAKQGAPVMAIFLVIGGFILIFWLIRRITRPASSISTSYSGGSYERPSYTGSYGGSSSSSRNTTVFVDSGESYRAPSRSRSYDDDTPSRSSSSSWGSSSSSDSSSSSSSSDSSSSWSGGGGGDFGGGGGGGDL